MKSTGFSKNNVAGCDILLLSIALILSGLGVIMVFSSSAAVGLHMFHSSTAFLKRQVEWFSIGLVLMLLFYSLNYRHLKKMILPWLLLTITPILMLSLNIIGTPIRGANRWIRFLGYSCQPSEFAKIGIVIYLAYILEKKQCEISSFDKAFLPPMILSLFFAVSVYFQPDTGSAVLIISITVLMCFVAGIPKKYLIIAFFAFIVPVGILLVSSSKYRLKRIEVFLHPEKYAQGAGFQARQSLIALGSGGFWGRGLGKSHQKLFFLPEAHTDFMFSIIGEELGFLGSSLVIALFSIMIMRGFRIATHAQTHFGTLLAFGISGLLALNFIINLGVITALLPTKGLALPFLSFGGSSLVSNMIGVGILLNISAQS